MALTGKFQPVNRHDLYGDNGEVASAQSLVFPAVIRVRDLFARRLTREIIAPAIFGQI